MTENDEVKSTSDLNAELVELREACKELALAHDEVAAKVDRLHTMLVSHQHGKLGNPMFPPE